MGCILGLPYLSVWLEGMTVISSISLSYKNVHQGLGKKPQYFPWEGVGCFLEKQRCIPFSMVVSCELISGVET